MMITAACPAELRLHALQQLFSMATYEASTVMSRWTGGVIALELAEVREIPLKNACKEFYACNKRLTMVVLPLHGELGGVMIFHFDEENARHLAATLMEQPRGAYAPWSEMEKSAITETGNILGCAYLNVISRLIDRPLVPTAPYFLQDYGASVFQRALADQAFSGDCVLIFRTGFLGVEKDLNWSALFVPTTALRARMEKALRGV
jgi:chemotaxis protein CheC